MSSSYKSLDIFGSGPHRFSLGKEGLYVVSNAAVAGPTVPGSLAYGLLELDVVVTGRLVAASEAALWTIRDAVTALLVQPQTEGVLVDHHGRTWTGMKFIRFETADLVDRGRVVSVGYTAIFRDQL